MLVLTSVALFTLAAGAGAATWWTRRGWLSRRRTQRLIVHTVEGQTIEGSLRDVGPDGIVLAAARLVDVDVHLAGDVWVPRPKILMVQHHRDEA